MLTISHPIKEIVQTGEITNLLCRLRCDKVHFLDVIHGKIIPPDIVVVLGEIISRPII